MDFEAANHHCNERKGKRQRTGNRPTPRVCVFDLEMTDLMQFYDGGPCAGR
jgi:hypothetical protein